MKNSIKKGVTVLVATGVLLGGLQAGTALGANNPFSALKPTAENSYVFKTYAFGQNGAEARIETLSISGLGNSELEKQLNELLAENSQAAYSKSSGSEAGYALCSGYGLHHKNGQCANFDH